MTEIADLIQQQFVFVIQKATPDDPVVCPLVVQRDVSSQAAAERTQQLAVCCGPRGAFRCRFLAQT